MKSEQLKLQVTVPPPAPPTGSRPPASRLALTLPEFAARHAVVGSQVAGVGLSGQSGGAQRCGDERRRRTRESGRVSQARTRTAASSGTVETEAAVIGAPRESLGNQRGQSIWAPLIIRCGGDTSLYTARK